MLGCNIKGYKRPCTAVVGGVSNLYVGDANDFEFTEGALVNGDVPGYSVIAYRPGAGALPSNAVRATTSFTVDTLGSTGGAVVIEIADTVYADRTGVIPRIADFNISGDAEDTSQFADEIKNAINLGSATHGWIATGVDNSITVSGPLINAASFNGKYLNFIINNPGTSKLDRVFAGGVNGSGGGAYLYEINSLEDSINFKATQSYADGSSEYAYEIKAKAVKLGQTLTNFTKKMDAAAACCQLIYVAVMNDGTVLVAGEKFVNGSQLPKWKIRQDGTVLDSGTVFKSFNGGDLSFKGTYLRGPYEFIGGLNALTPFIAPN